MKKNEKRANHKYFDSMAQAAAIVNLPVEHLQVAKDSGCSAFRGSRVYLQPLKEWLEKHPDKIQIAAETQTLEQRKLLADASFREHRLLVAKRELISVEEGKRIFVSASIQVKTKLLTISTRLAHKIALVTDPVKIGQEIDDEIKSVLREVIQKHHGHLELKCPHCRKLISAASD